MEKKRGQKIKIHSPEASPRLSHIQKSTGRGGGCKGT